MYNKLFTTILDSSIWLEPTHVRIVWITLLAAMNKDGYAHFSAIGNLASRARISEGDTLAAVEVLTSPDPHNPDQPNEGRRIERVPGGYMVLNAAKYRAMHNAEMQLEANRERVARCRAKKATAEQKKTDREAKKKTRTKSQARANHINGETAFVGDMEADVPEAQASEHAARVSGDKELIERAKS